MSESFVEVTPGTGVKLHSKQRSIGGNTVEDPVSLLGEAYLATSVLRVTNIAVATASSHLVQLMAGASLKLYIRSIFVQQARSAAAATGLDVQAIRLTSAGTGGTAAGIEQFDPGDPAEGAAAQTLPTSLGGVGAVLLSKPLGLVAAAPFPRSNGWEWVQGARSKPIIVPAGASNGLAIRNIQTDANAHVAIEIIFDEVAF